MPTIICPLCSSQATEQFWSTVWNATNKQVMLCKSCDSFFLDPPETAGEQRRFDSEYDSYIHARAELVTKHTTSTFEVLVDESIEIRFQDLKQFFDRCPSVLEVGAEKGGFLDRVSQMAGHLAAVDACPEYKEILQKKGYKAFSYVWDIPAGDVYDRICLFSLLEHIHSPQPFLARLVDCLTATGKIILEVPSAKEPLVSLYNVAAFKSFYFQAMHPYVYGEKALRMLLRECGLKIEQTIYKQRYGLANHLQWLKDGTPGGNPYFSELFSGNADVEYIKSLEASGYTDTLYVIATRG